MSSKPGNRFITGIIVLLITVWLIPATAGASAPGEKRQHGGFDMKGPHRPALGFWRDPHMIQELELTTAQVKQIRDADFAFREKRLALKSQLDRLHLQLDRAFSSGPVDDTAVLSLAKQISEIKGKLFVQEIEARLAIGKLLDVDQIKKLRLYDMHREKRGPGGAGLKKAPGCHSIEPPHF